MAEQAREPDSRGADAAATAHLVQLLEGFNEDSALATRGMRELLDDDCPQFLRAAQPLLKNISESRGLRSLITLLWSRGLFLKVLCDPSILRLDEAVQLARAAIGFNPVLEKVLARCLLDTNEAAALDDAFQERLLEIMAGLSEGDQLLPPATLQHPNVRIRSKAALLIGRTQNNSRWLQRRMTEADPRVRANAIEAVWGTNDDECKHILWNAVTDEHHRVCGNALVGLYRFGETRSIALLIEMSEHQAAPFRSAAAWAMGNTRDPRFLPVLAGMFSRCDGQLRKTIFTAISKIKQSTARWLEAGKLCVSISEPSALPDGYGRIGATVTTPQGSPATGLQPTHFVVWEGLQPIAQFEVRKHALPPALLMGFLIPGVDPDLIEYRDYVERSLFECKKYQRAGDLWCVWEYSMAPVGLGKLHGPGQAAPTPHIPEAAFRFLTGSARPEADRHLVLIGPEHPRGHPPFPGMAEEFARLGAAADAANATVHVLRAEASGDDYLDHLCPHNRGREYRIQSRQQMPFQLERICRSVLESYDIVYRLPQPDALQAPVRLQVYSPAGCGENTCDDKDPSPKESARPAD